MSAEEFGWWLVMMENEWIGPARQSQLLAYIAAGVRNGPIQGPAGDKSLWRVRDFIDPDRWAPPKPKDSTLTLEAIKGWFGRFGFK
jgi:hypothetical protein